MDSVKLWFNLPAGLSKNEMDHDRGQGDSQALPSGRLSASCSNAVADPSLPYKPLPACSRTRLTRILEMFGVEAVIDCKQVRRNVGGGSDGNTLEQDISKKK